MATGLYDKGREAFLKGEISWSGANIKAVLVESTYSVSLTTHDLLDDIPVGVRAATSANLAGKDTVDGVASASDITFTGVLAGPACNAVVLYEDTGAENTSQLIAYIDSANATGLPVTPNGGDISVTWDTGANKIFKL